jgi:hypothetical protein
MEKNYATPGSLRKSSDEILATLKLKPKSLFNLIKRAALLLFISICFTAIYDLGSLRRHWDDAMAKSKFWSTATAAAALTRTSAMQVLDLSTASWTVSNEVMNVSVPGSLPSVVRNSL